MTRSERNPVLWSLDITILFERWWKSRRAGLLGTCFFGPSLFEEFYTPAYQHCMWQNEVPPAWVLEIPSPGIHFCFAVSIVFVVKREKDLEKGKQTNGWNIMLAISVMIQVFHIWFLMGLGGRKLRGRKTKRTRVAERKESKWQEIGRGEVKARWKKKQQRKDSVAGQCRAERQGELSVIWIGGWARYTWSESCYSTESQPKLLGEPLLSHTSRQSSFSAHLCSVTVCGLSAKANKVSQSNELGGDIRT